MISPQSIANGKGDRYIVSLGKALAHRRKPTYIRLMPEMNGYWNRYSAYGSDGKLRDKFTGAGGGSGAGTGPAGKGGATEQG